MITRSTIQKFQEVVQSEYGISLNDKDAEETLFSLVGYFDLLAKIDHRIQPKN